MTRNLKLEYRISKLEKQIYESKQVGDLYHICTPDSYVKYIYPNDQLSASGKYTNYLYKGNDYISFTRDKYFVVATETIKNSAILFQLVIDGDKLSDNYKVRPYNDFAFTNYNYNSKLLEKEEVVKGPIKNISKYIKEIHFDLFGIDDKIANDLNELANDPAIKSSNVVYYTFMRNKTDKLKRLIKEANIKNGDPIQLVAERLSYALANDSEPLLFSGNIDDIQKAIDQNADLNARYERGYLLDYYCRDKYLQIVELLLKSGAKLELPNMSAVINAAKYDQVKLLDLFIKHGANINTVDSDGDSPLMWAAMNDNYNAVEFLANHGANVNATDNDGESAYTLTDSRKIKSLLKSHSATYFNN